MDHVLRGQLIGELSGEEGRLAVYGRRIRILNRLERLGFKESSFENRGVLVRPSFEILEKAYVQLAGKLRERYLLSAMKTTSEYAVSGILSAGTKLEFKKSMWIGNRNVDFFCPALGELYSPRRTSQKRLGRGLVLEVDGSIHDRELKMRKDTSKYEFCHSLGLIVVSIPNEDINSLAVKDLLINKIRTLQRLDARARKRLLRKIYVITLAYHLDDVRMEELYGKSFFQMLTSPLPTPEQRR